MSDQKIIDGDEEFNQYREVVLFIKELIKKGYAQFDFSFEASTFNVRKDIDFGELYQKHGIDDGVISKFIKNILTKVNILLAGKEEAASPIKGTDGEQETPAQFHERCKIVEKELVNNSLRRRYFLHITYKTTVIDKFDWEVVVKKHIGPELDKNFPTATLRLRLRKPFTENPPVMKTETVVFETELRELNELIEELEDIRDALKKGEKSF